jgi:hypothetical protein
MPELTTDELNAELAEQLPARELMHCGCGCKGLDVDVEIEAEISL